MSAPANQIANSEIPAVAAVAAVSAPAAPAAPTAVAPGNMPGMQSTGFLGMPDCAEAARIAALTPPTVSLDACELKEGIEFCSPGCCCLEYDDDTVPLSLPCALDGCNKEVEDGNYYCSLTCQSASTYNDAIARIIAESKAIREAPVSAFADLNDDDEIPEVDIDAA